MCIAKSKSLWITDCSSKVTAGAVGAWIRQLTSQPTRQTTSQAAPAQCVGKVPAKHIQSMCVCVCACVFTNATAVLIVYIFWIAKGKTLKNIHLLT